MKWAIFSRAVTALVCGLASLSVQAYDEPAVNLGLTSFMDGGPPSGPGVYFQNYTQFYTTKRFNDNNGNQLPLPKTDLDLIVNVAQAIFLTNTRLLSNASLGFTMLLPWLPYSHIDDGLNNSVLKKQEGVGDLILAPVLQFDPVMRANGKEPLFVQRFELDFMLPTGNYASDLAINPSAHFWSFNPYWAATLWISSKWTSSIRLHYLWNAINNRPNVSFGPQARNTQAGQAVFANFATDYALTDKFRPGINGYFFNQFTDTRVNGIDVPGRRERVWAIGPGMLYTLTKEQFLFLNLYFEQDARNRPQGTNFVLRYAIHI